jgi:hypothetical protein
MSDALVGFDELVRSGDSGETKLTVFVGNNLGHRTLEAKLPVFELFRMSDVANERGSNGEPVAQRKLDPTHARGLAIYTLKGLIAATIAERTGRGEPITEALTRIEKAFGKQPYMSLQPIVANLRTAGTGGKNLRGEPLRTPSGDTVGFRFWLSQRDILWIVDGQHRRKALDMVFEFLDDVRLHQTYPPKKQSLYSFDGDDRSVPPDELNVWLECCEIARGVCTVALEIHLGLTIEEERQLFHDLNNLAKKVDKNLALEFDMANPINAFIKEELHDQKLVQIIGKDSSDWESDDGSMSRKELVAVNAHLFLNKSNINGASPAIVVPRIAIAKRFWEAVSQIPGFGEEGAKVKTVAAQPVVLKAVAKLAYDFAFGRQRNEGLLDRLLDGITEIDFSHSNPMWRYYELLEEECTKHKLQGLADYLPSDDEGKNRDIGKYDPAKGWMRFGAKHNDIFPILGDMIRWRLNLPTRSAKGSSEADE